MYFYHHYTLYFLPFLGSGVKVLDVRKEKRTVNKRPFKVNNSYNNDITPNFFVFNKSKMEMMISPFPSFFRTI